VLSWRLVNFWLPIPTGALAYVSLKVPKGGGLRGVRRALAEMTARSTPASQQPLSDARPQDPPRQPATQPHGTDSQPKDPPRQPATQPHGTDSQPKDPPGQS
jgi:hypothetical protein